MNVIRNSFLPEARISLGRWNTSYATSSINSKVDLANEDHCGPCGQYAMERLEKKMELRIREVEKKTDGLQNFLTKV